MSTHNILFLQEIRKIYIQYNCNGSNTDGSFTVDDSTLFSVPTKFFQ